LKIFFAEWNCGMKNFLFLRFRKKCFLNFQDLLEIDFLQIVLSGGISVHCSAGNYIIMTRIGYQQRRNWEIRTTKEVKNAHRCNNIDCVRNREYGYPTESLTASCKAKSIPWCACTTVLRCCLLFEYKFYPIGPEPDYCFDLQ